MKIAAHAELLHLEFTRAAALRRADERVILRLVEVADVADVGAELAGECLCIEHRYVLSTVAVQPGEVGERKRRRRAVSAAD